MKAGRCIARPSALANVAFVTGFGAVALTGPATAVALMAQRTRATQSSRWIHGQY